MSAKLLKETIKRELPGLLRDDPGLRAYVLGYRGNESGIWAVRVKAENPTGD